MPLQVLVGEFVGYSALFLRTIEGKPTCPQYHKLDPYKSCLVLRAAGRLPTWIAGGGSPTHLYCGSGVAAIPVSRAYH